MSQSRSPAFKYISLSVVISNSPLGRLYSLRSGTTRRLEAKPRNMIVRPQTPQLLFKNHDSEVPIEFNNTEALRILNIETEHGSTPFFRPFGSTLEHIPKSVSIEDVISQNHCTSIISDEILSYDESLRQTIRTELYSKRKKDTEPMSVINK